MPSTDERVYKEIGKRIAKARKAKGWSQLRLAVEAKLSRTHPGYIEQGYRKPTITTLNRIAKALDMKLEDLFKNL